MENGYRQRYRGPLKLAIFDWAGTTVDYGCMAPAAAFTELFSRHGVEVTVAQARGPMGLHKRDHIATMLQMPEVAEKWRTAHGSDATEDDVERLFQEFIPLQLDVLKDYAKVIPGAPECAAALRERDLKIAGTTGYNEAMMQLCMEGAARDGYRPDISIAVTMVPAGRPAPWMAVKAAMELGIYPFEAIVKVGDTVTDIDEGRNAGMWTVGVLKTGNELGLSQGEAEALPPHELEQRLQPGRTKLAKAGAHYIVDSVAEVPAVVDTINGRLAHGEHP